MLSEKVKNYLIETGLYDETEDTNYQKVMLDLGIKLDTTFALSLIHIFSKVFLSQENMLQKKQ